MSISDGGGRHQESRNREEVKMSQKANVPGDRGQIFDGIKIGRPATGALLDAGYWSLSDLPEDLAELSDLHGVGPRAVALLKDARGR